MQEDHVTSLYMCLYKAFQGAGGRLNVDYRVFSLPNMVLLHPFSPFTVPFIWVMSSKSTHFSVGFGPGDVGRCAPSSWRPALASGERDFPASHSLRWGTSWQEVCSTPKLTLSLTLLGTFYHFPTALRAQTTICLILLRLHSSNPCSLHFPSCSGILATPASLQFLQAPKDPDHRAFLPAHLHPHCCSPGLIWWVLQVAAQESLCWPSWPGQIPLI